MVGDVKLLARAVDGIEIKDLKSLADEGKKQLGSGVVALVATTEDGKASIVVGVTPDLRRAVLGRRSGAQGLRGAGRQGRRREARHGAGRRSGWRQGRGGAGGDRRDHRRRLAARHPRLLHVWFRQAGAIRFRIVRAHAKSQWPDWGSVWSTVRG